MRHITAPVLSLLLTSTACAQLTNGSFEQDGAFSMLGWLTTCGDAGEGSGGAPGSGAWHATKQPGHLKGCFPSYIYQLLPEATQGQVYTVAGWVRCDSEEPCMGGYLGLARVAGEFITVDDLSGAASDGWTYVSITDTVELGANEQACVALTAGSIGGPALLNPAHFDGITVNLATSVSEALRPAVVHYLDREARSLSIALPDGQIDGVRLVDISGRNFPVTLERSARNTVRVALSGLPSGAYFATVRTPNGDHTIRFTLW